MATFFECETPYENAEFVIAGAPFDSTASFRPGARFASRTMRTESYALEYYSPYLDRDLADLAVHDAGELELCIGDAQKALGTIERHTALVMADGRLSVLIGGEHLVTLGAVRAAAKQYPGLHVLHFDAHTDLRDAYLGAALSHATVLRRVWEIVGDKRIFQFGVRSGEREEWRWAREHVQQQRFDFAGLAETVRRLQDNPVYLTIDLDVLDPSVLPGTGTPEPGGVGFLELLDAVYTACRANIVACDLTELCPVYDPSGASTAVALKILRELLLALKKP